MLKKLKLLLAVLVVAVPVVTAVYCRHMFTLVALKANYILLKQFVESHFAAAALSYLAAMTVNIALTIPGATTMSLAGGVLFPQPYASVLAYCGYIIGASLSYSLVHGLLASYVRSVISTESELFKTFERNVHKNALLYIILARYTVVFPFWFVNGAAAIIGVPFRTFFLATCIAVIPGSVLYTSAGSAISGIIMQMDSKALQGLSTWEILYKAVINNRELQLCLGLLVICGIIPVTLKLYLNDRTEKGKAHQSKSRAAKKTK